MASLKSLMNCIGVNTNQNLSVLFHVFGYTEGQVPADPDGSTAVESVKAFMQDVQEKHFHVNMITVGIDNFTAAERARVDYSIYRSRKIFRTVGPNFGRIERFEITASESNGRNDISSPGEATDLTQEWTVPNNGMDVFLVENISDPDFIGISEINGPCDKDAKGRNGVIGGEVNLGNETFAKTVAHEIGHYLGLKHNHGNNCPGTVVEQDNLMAQSRCASTDGDAGQRLAMNLTSSQGTKMKKHCFVKSGC